MFSYLWNSSLRPSSERCCSTYTIFTRLLPHPLPPRPAPRRGRHFLGRIPRDGSSHRRALSAWGWVYVSPSNWTTRLKRQHQRPIAFQRWRVGAGLLGVRRRCRAGSGAEQAVSMAAAAASLSDKERFICIYPAYLNNKKTIAEGRRIPIDKAVENPTSTEIQDVCAAVGFNVLLEKNKMYPREWNRDVQYRGRVRIQLKQDDGNPCLPQFPTRKSVMLYAAETIPKLKTRTQKMGGSDQSLQQGEGGKKDMDVHVTLLQL
uniref:Signal recognition particle 19 kDa protein n=1 Tax=Anser cygnoides TaxID=8845 RepID=A0A8B9EG18_ANSCY